MKRILVFGGSALILGVTPVLAQDTNVNLTINQNQTVTNVVETTAEELFRPIEFDLDAFGTLAVSEHTIDHLTGHRLYHHSRLGAGAGGDFFFCRYIGIEGEAYSEDTSPHFINDAGGNLLVRIPIDVIHLAPYGLAGGGYKWDPFSSRYADAGAGLEVRFTPNIGVFADGRWVWPERDGNYFLGRAGLRIAL